MNGGIYWVYDDSLITGSTVPIIEDIHEQGRSLGSNPIVGIVHNSSSFKYRFREISPVVGLTIGLGVSIES